MAREVWGVIQLATGNGFAFSNSRSNDLIMRTSFPTQRMLISPNLTSNDTSVLTVTSAALDVAGAIRWRGCNVIGLDGVLNVERVSNESLTERMIAPENITTSKLAVGAVTSSRLDSNLHIGGTTSVHGHVLPSEDSSYSLGDSVQRFESAHINVITASNIELSDVTSCNVNADFGVVRTLEAGDVHTSSLENSNMTTSNLTVSDIIVASNIHAVDAYIRDGFNSNLTSTFTVNTSNVNAVTVVTEGILSSSIDASVMIQTPNLTATALSNQFMSTLRVSAAQAIDTSNLTTVNVQYRDQVGSNLTATLSVTTSNIQTSNVSSALGVHTSNLTAVTLHAKDMFASNLDLSDTLIVPSIQSSSVEISTSLMVPDIDALTLSNQFIDTNFVRTEHLTTTMLSNQTMHTRDVLCSNLEATLAVTTSNVLTSNLHALLAISTPSITSVNTSCRDSLTSNVVATQTLTTSNLLTSNVTSVLTMNTSNLVAAGTITTSTLLTSNVTCALTTSTSNLTAVNVEFRDQEGSNIVVKQSISTPSFSNVGGTTFTSTLSNTQSTSIGGYAVIAKGLSACNIVLDNAGRTISLSTSNSCLGVGTCNPSYTIDVSGTGRFSSNVVVEGVLTVKSFQYVYSNLTVYSSEVIQSNLVVQNEIASCNVRASNASVHHVLDASNVVAMTVTAKNIETSNLMISGPIVPSVSEAFDLGSSNLRFRDLYLSGSTVNLGGTTISAKSNMLVTSNLNVSGEISVDTVSATAMVTTSNITTSNLTSSIGLSTSNLTATGVVTTSNIATSNLTALLGVATCNLTATNTITTSSIATSNLSVVQGITTSNLGVGRAPLSNYALDVVGDVNIVGNLLSNGQPWSLTTSNNYDPTIARMLLKPMRITSITPSTPTSAIYTATATGNLEAVDANVEVTINGIRLAYVSPAIADYTVAYSFNISTYETTFTVTLAAVPNEGDVVDIVIWASGTTVGDYNIVSVYNAPLRLTRQYDSNTADSNLVFSIQSDGYYTASARQVDVALNGYQLAYVDENAADYDLSIVRGQDSNGLPTSQFNVSLLEAPQQGDVIDIMVFPELVMTSASSSNSSASLTSGSVITDYIADGAVTSRKLASNVTVSGNLTLSQALLPSTSNITVSMGSTGFRFHTVFTSNVNATGVVSAGSYGNLPVASTSLQGIVMLDSSTASTSSNTAATSLAVKLAMDAATLNVRSNVTLQGTTLASGTLGVGLTGSNVPQYTLDVNGSIYATQDIIAFSDERYKYDLQPVEDAVDRVKAMNGYTFRRRDMPTFAEGERRHLGLLAQEVERVLPEVVYRRRHDDNDTELLSVAYGNIVALLIEAIKELADRLDASDSVQDSVLESLAGLIAIQQQQRT